MATGPKEFPGVPAFSSRPVKAAVFYRGSDEWWGLYPTPEEANAAVQEGVPNGSLPRLLFALADKVWIKFPFKAYINPDLRGWCLHVQFGLEGPAGLVEELLTCLAKCGHVAVRYHNTISCNRSK